MLSFSLSYPSLIFYNLRFNSSNNYLYYCFIFNCVNMILGDIMDVMIGVSNRHVHLRKSDLEVLFGKDFNLEVKKELVQPGQYASNSVVTIKTLKSEIENVRVLGPVRDYTQVEISKTDAFKLGINPPVRDSGCLSGSEGITIIGPNGSISLDEGCIIATRHIHISPIDIHNLGLDGVKEVSVKLKVKS